MTSISDERLFESSSRVKDRVVLITGAANGIGRQAAVLFASYGAKVVIGDRDISGARAVVSEITRKGGDAFANPCDVTVWDDVVALYECAIREYGTVDIVVANAGITERGQFHTVNFENGRPVKPDLATLDVNLFGLINTVHLAQHYLTLKPGDLKSIVMLGSMASWIGIPGAAMYSASKHAALGIMRSLHSSLELRDIRIGILHPFFSDTAIIPSSVKLFLAGIPMTPVERIAGTIFFIATDADPGTNGCAFMLPDDGLVFTIPKEEFKLGVYQMMDERRNKLLQGVKGLTYVARCIRDVVRVLRRPMFLAVVVALSTTAWKYRKYF